MFCLPLIFTTVLCFQAIYGVTRPLQLVPFHKWWSRNIHTLQPMAYVRILYGIFLDIKYICMFVISHWDDDESPHLRHSKSMKSFNLFHNLETIYVWFFYYYLGGFDTNTCCSIYYFSRLAQRLWIWISVFIFSGIEIFSFIEHKCSQYIHNKVELWLKKTAWSSTHSVF